MASPCTDFFILGDKDYITYEHKTKNGDIYDLTDAVIAECKMYFWKNKSKKRTDIVEKSVEFTSENGGDGKLTFFYDPLVDTFMEPGKMRVWTKVVHIVDGVTKIRHTIPVLFDVFNTGDFQ